MRKSVLLLPAVAVLLCFFIVPIVLTVYYSFTNMALSGSNARNLKFIGLENYQRMLTDPSTITAIRNTLVFLAGSLAGQTILGFAIAYFMKQKARAFRSVVGPCFLVGWVMPEIVVALCFMAFFKENGTLNVLLGAVGIKGIAWLYEHPMLSVIIANVWHGTAVWSCADLSSGISFWNWTYTIRMEIISVPITTGITLFMLITWIPSYTLTESPRRVF